jgi:hypothetical protein
VALAAKVPYEFKAGGVAQRSEYGSLFFDFLLFGFFCFLFHNS